MRTQHGTSEANFATVLSDAVVFARSTQDVVDPVRLCVAAGVPIVPFGAGTSIEGNPCPHAAGSASGRGTGVALRIYTPAGTGPFPLHLPHP